MAFIMTDAASCDCFIINSYQHLLQPLPLPALLQHLPHLDGAEAKIAAQAKQASASYKSPVHAWITVHICQLNWLNKHWIMWCDAKSDINERFSP
ncbi:hypothetical protein CUN67_25640 (plasmid) [Pantoea cypripedii]|uniref:Uncharacterized protein n=1 Tax=Pantoea cypripedii TaxID=55209 RepID=A0A6B9G5M3_PANCY|nr:hypothetical protein CUN67_25640 [Pantoea cypripedii]